LPEKQQNVFSVILDIHKHVAWTANLYQIEFCKWST